MALTFILYQLNTSPRYRMKKSSNSLYYLNNKEYTEFLSSINIGWYQKYIDFLEHDLSNGKILDIGCGTGLVVEEYSRDGFDAYGVDVSLTSIESAKKRLGNYRLIKDENIPFPDKSFDSVGSFTVLEHVHNPELLIREMVRVLKPGGNIVIAAPNFLRVMGLSSHHRRTKGIISSFRNFFKLLAKLPKNQPGFELMEKINDKPFKPDYDAVCVTNPIDIIKTLKLNGINIKYYSGFLNHKSKTMDFIGKTWPFKYLIGGVFILGKKKS